MRIIKDEDAIFQTDNYDVILVGTSVYDLLTHGFQGKLSNKYPHVAEANHKQPYGDMRRIGTRLTLEKEGCPIISLLYICGYPMRGLKSIDYEALEKCLRTSAAEFKGKRIITTIMGSNTFDGGGDKKKILKIMKSVFEDADIDIYDYPQGSVQTELDEKRRLLKSIGVNDKKKRKDILQKLYLLKNG